MTAERIDPMRDALQRGRAPSKWTMSRRDEIAKAIGVRVAGVRRHIGLTQRQVASAAGIQKNTVSMIERGMHELHASTLMQLAGALGVPETVLLVGLKWRPGESTFEISDVETCLHLLSELCAGSAREPFA